MDDGSAANLARFGRVAGRSVRIGDRLEFGQRGFGHDEWILLPVIAVEEFDGKEAGVVDLAKGFEDVGERRDAVAGVDAIGIGELGTIELRIVVDVDDADGSGREELEALEIGAAFVEVIDVGKDASAGASALGGDEPGFAEASERLGKTPNFQHGSDAAGLTEIEQGPVAIRGGEEIDGGFEVLAAGGADGGRGDPLAAEVPSPLHVALGSVEPLAATLVVIDDPLGETDDARDDKPGVGDPFGEVLQRSARFLIGIKLGDPRLEASVPGLGGEIDKLLERSVLSPITNGAGIQAKSERLQSGMSANGTRSDGDGATEQLPPRN